VDARAATVEAQVGSAAKASAADVWKYHDEPGRTSESSASTPSTRRSSYDASSTTSVSLAGIGVQSRGRAWLVLGSAAVLLVGAGAVGAYFALGGADPPPSPSAPAEEQNPLEIGNPLPSGLEAPEIDFVSGGARARPAVTPPPITTVGGNVRASDATKSTAPPRSDDGSTASATSTPVDPGGHASTPRDPPDLRPPDLTADPVEEPEPERPREGGETGSSAPDDAPEERDIQLELYGAQVRFVIRRYYAARAQSCFDRATRNNNELRGTVVVAFTITADGHVGNSSVSRNTTGEHSLGECLANQVRTWRLPAPGVELEYEIPFSR
jgi:hypothetical protein